MGVGLRLPTSEIRRLYLYVVLCTAILLHAIPVSAQSAAEVRDRTAASQTEDRQRANVLGLNSPTARLSTSLQSALALDAPIDPDTYILGPGDLLGISLRGGVGAYYTAQISPEGNLIVPQLPMLQLDGMTLSDAKVAIRAAWSSDLQEIPLDITLLQMRQMRVSVGGSVAYPGQYVVTPADRALTLIDLAGGLSEEASERHAVLIEADGNRSHVDLLRYRRFGSKEANPMLTAGAHLVVEPVTPADERAVIEIGGAVVFPETYEWVEGDAVCDVIEVAGGFRAVADRDSVLLTRFVNGTPETQIVDLSNPQGGRGFDVQPGDLVYVPDDLSRTPKRATVMVRGEVVHPGRYPIIADQTSLLDLLEQVGGLTSEASLRGTRIWRVRNVSSGIELEIERLDTLDALLIGRSELNFLRDYKRSQDRDYIGVDFVKLMGNDEEAVTANNILLVDSLIINVPRQVHYVRVMGAVERPGMYGFQEGWSYKDYVKAAGGYLKESDKRNVRLLQYESNQFHLARNKLDIYSGDTIYVPEKWLPPFWDTFRQYFSVFLQAATLALLIISTSP